MNTNEIPIIVNQLKTIIDETILIVGPSIDNAEYVIGYNRACKNMNMQKEELKRVVDTFFKKKGEENDRKSNMC